MTFASDPVRALLRTAGPLPAEPRVLCLGDDTLARLLPACGAHVDTQARTDTEARAGIEAPANVDAAAGTSYHMVCGPEADRRHLPLLAPGGVVVGDTVIRRAEDEALRRRLAVADCPRAAAYPPRWVLDYEMGPNPLWLTEALAADMDLAPGMRVLDLGCGNALTSVFLAREFASVVWAADLWIDPGPNWARIRAAGVDDVVFPVKAEAHELPFAPEFFDAIVAIDSYEYFGSDDRLSEHVRKAGRADRRGPADHIHRVGRRDARAPAGRLELGVSHLAYLGVVAPALGEDRQGPRREGSRDPGFGTALA